MSRVAIVSGGAGALGTAIVRELAGRGHRVVIAYRTREDEARALVESVGGAAAALAVAADLADPAGPETIVSAARAAFGDPTILVNNAGIMSTSPVEEMSDAQWDEMTRMITDDMLEEFCVIGTWDQLPAQMREKFAGINTQVTLPIDPRTPDEEAQFREIIAEVKQIPSVGEV